jgi:hypothetical protein
MKTPTPGNENPKIRAAYEAPKLSVHGGVSAITKAVDMSGMDDGGGAGMNKT